MRRTFGPVILLGLAAGTLAAVAGSKPWVEPRSADGQTQAFARFVAVGGDSGELPVATSLALVALACWGVVLVTRGRPRRAVAVLGLIASAGLVAAVVWSWFTLADTFASDLAAAAGSPVRVRHTPWAYGGSVGAVLALVAAAVAVRAVGEWPEMGTRYDAPTTPPTLAQVEADGGEVSNLDLWKAIDAGHDPTD
ncbi:TIGR02234 family membrane protein [Nocardioides fonticola]|uniref:TIGR02234 family membrane protein n=1 Tax=Nocardioides fonticola TaxID=450363 RepID=A0ABP7X9A5_9ACTN